MRRLMATVAVASLFIGMLGLTPAGATHCDQGNITACPEPATVIVIEGVGNVCSKAVLSPAEAALYTSKCVYNYSDPSWASKSVSPWNQSGGANGSKYQGLFWPGVGPGAIGPYSLRISPSASPPNNLCVSSVGGPGCQSESAGKLTPGNQSGTGLTGIGAHCGSSNGSGVVKFRSADGSLLTEGTSAWEQSAATILPLRGQILRGTRNGTPFVYPTDKRPTLTGFTSSRGLGGAGNCGITDPTTGFQVEGMVVTF